jgi:hypothetical protein
VDIKGADHARRFAGGEVIRDAAADHDTLPATSGVEVC